MGVWFLSFVSNVLVRVLVALLFSSIVLLETPSRGSSKEKVGGAYPTFSFPVRERVRPREVSGLLSFSKDGKISLDSRQYF